MVVTDTLTPTTDNANIDPMLLGFKMAVDQAVSRLNELDEELADRAGTGRRVVNRTALDSVGDTSTFTSEIVRQIRELSGSDAKKTLGLMIAVEKALDDAFKTQVDAYVEKELAEQQKSDGSTELSAEDRTAKVKEYQEKYDYLVNLINILDHTPNGEQVKSGIPFTQDKNGETVLAFKKRKVMTAERSPQGPRLPRNSVWTFSEGSSVLGKKFPELAERLGVDALEIKKAMARSNGVENPDDNDALTQYFRTLDKVSRVSFQVTDKEGNNRSVVAVREQSSDEDGEDTSDDDDDNGDDSGADLRLV